MPVLINNDTQLAEDLPQIQADSALKAGTHSLPLNDAQGNPVTASLDEAHGLLNQGYSQPSQDELNQSLLKSKYSTPLEEAKTFAQGIGAGASFGTSTGIARILGANQEGLINRPKVNPGFFGAGDVTGLVGSSFIPGMGEANVLRNAGEGAAGAIGLGATEGAGLLSRMGSAATKGGVETALMAAGDENSKFLAGDPDQTWQTAAVNVGLSGVLGAGVSAPFGAISPVWKAINGSRIGQFVEDFKNQVQNRVNNPNPVAAVADELGAFHNDITSAADEVYGANGLKAKEISKLVPEMNDKISQQSSDIFNQLQSTIKTMESKPNSYPERLVDTLRDDLQTLKDGTFPEVQRPKGLVNVDPGVPEIAQQKVSFTPIRFDENPAKQAFPWLRDSDVPPRLISGEEQPIQVELRNPNSSEPINYQPVNFSNKSSQQVFNSLQELKQKLQSYSKFDKFIKPTDEAYGFVNSVKSLGSSVRSALENPDVWENAAVRQKEINGAFREYLPALKDFEKKFTSLVGDDRVIDPAKVQTYMNQLGNPKAELKQEMLKNFFDASDKYKSVIEGTHANLGIESPFQNVSTNQSRATLNQVTPGAKVANALINKGLSRVGGEALGAGVGAGIGHMLGSGWIGAIVGEHALGPVFSSVLPSISKAILEKPTSAEGFKNAIQMGVAAVKGESMVTRAVKSILDPGLETLPKSYAMSEEKRDKIKEKLDEINEDPSSLLDVGNQTGHYLPAHGSSIASTTVKTTQFLKTLKPSTDKLGPLDPPKVVSKDQQAKYDRAIDIAEQPLTVLQHLKDGTLQSQDVIQLKTTMPGLYDRISQKMTEEMISHTSKEKTIPYQTRLGMSLFLGQPIDSTMTPQSIQMNQPTNQSAPQPQQNTQQKGQKHSMAALGKIGQESMTPLDSRESQKHSLS